jgi:hypothetical protein
MIFRFRRGSGNALPGAALALLTLGELRLLDRLLFSDSVQYGFVLESVRGVLAGTPVSKSWQHRLLAPFAVRALEAVLSTPLAALERFTQVMVFVANLTLFVLLRRRGVAPWAAFAVCAAFGLARLLSTYKLEYPWDEVDIVLFTIFGYAASRGAPPLRLVPLLLVGAFNHETVLCLPFWFVLAPLKGTGRREAWREAAFGVAAGALLVAGITGLRSALYRGRPALADQVFETPAPLVENHLHFAHNGRQLFYFDWVEGRDFIAAAFLVAVAALSTCLARRVDVRACTWTLGFLLTVVAFGYVNETRHYLALLAFWFAYAGPSLVELAAAAAGAGRGGAPGS